MRNIKLTIEYDGSRYAGWQRQADQPTVQEEIENALEKLLETKTTLYGAGRTDAGVHALGQVANFKCDSSIPAEKFAPALQRFLPSDILILSSVEVPEKFHARFDARERTYSYRIGFRRSALFRNQRWEIDEKLPLEKLQEAARLFRGELDCSALCIPGSLQERNNCVISRSEWDRDAAADEYRYTVTANRFLHSMVRTIVGFCVKHARPGQLTLERIQDILTAGTWTNDHVIAPPQGLYLVEVTY